MRQQIQEKISSTILDYREGETVHLIHFPFTALPKIQGTRKGGGARNKPFTEQVAEVAAEQISHRCELDHLGVVITVIQQKRSGDLDNFVKNILDGLKQVAFKDDAVVDYVEVVRIKADTPDDVGFVVEIMKTSPKRGASWL
jgi:Holliday junction resolvase RusA-like endonuclease